VKRQLLIVLAAGCLFAERPAGAQIVADGGLEEGTPNPFWEEFSKNFGSPICSAETCTDFFGDAFEGDWWAWFGGAVQLEIGSLSQEVTIPPGTAALTFWLDTTMAGGNGEDFLTVSIDAVELFTVLESDEGSYHPWTQVTLDVSAFADGGDHLLSFDSTTLGPQRTNFFVDAIEITVEAALPGDFDGDGDVDLFDAAAYDACTTGPGGGADPPCDVFDFDDDNDVDFQDYGGFQLVFTG
jgi:hypothetical protein